MAKGSKKKKRIAERTPTKPEQPPGRQSAISWKLILLQASIIAAAVWWIYGPVLHGDWLWDDDVYVTQNPLLNDPARLWKAWFQPGSFVEYYPIQETVQWAQWKLWQTDTLGYHLTNILLHTVGALLVWRLLSKFGLRLAWLGGLLFAIHPVQVESVAWISELKNTLSLPPFLLAMCAFIDFDNDRRQRDYVLALVFFTMAMLCKITMAPFPAVILLYAWWKRGRIQWNDLKISIPFFLISLGLGLITVFAGICYQLSQHQCPYDVPIGGFFSRLALGGLSIAFYFSQCILPVILLPIYPKWIIDPHSILQFLPWLVLAGVICVCWKKKASWGRHILLGTGFFLLTLAPFVGFIGISYMDFTWVMDHFLYIPIIGLIALFVAAIEAIGNQLSTPLRPCGIGIVTMVVILLTWESHIYAAKFIDQATLSTYTLKYNPKVVSAYVNMGHSLELKNQFADAMAAYEQALKIDPKNAGAYYDIGNLLLKDQRFSEAIEPYEQALKISPGYVYARCNLGIALFRAHRFSEAIDQYKQALELNPDDPETLGNLGVALVTVGRTSEAIDCFNQALKIDPNVPGVRQRLDEALQQTAPTTK